LGGGLHGSNVARRKARYKE
jgi:hypothetical protein